MSVGERVGRVRGVGQEGKNLLWKSKWRVCVMQTEYMRGQANVKNKEFRSHSDRCSIRTETDNEKMRTLVRMRAVIFSKPGLS